MNLKNIAYFFISFLLLMSCKSTSTLKDSEDTPDFTIAFGSCNKQNSENVLWENIIANNPDVWIWGGDNIYSDTEDMGKMALDYEAQKNQEGYNLLKKNNIKVLGIWDDHDYGANDAGKEYSKREESQQLFLDFFDVPKSSSRRNREGIYHSKVFNTKKGIVKIILLDTRYFRDSLIRKNKVYLKNKRGTILGEKQWNWFENELNNSKANFNIIVSSIQVLAEEHRFEKWGNFPSELQRFKDVIASSKAKGITVLSGDRHISEFSKEKIDGLDYPLVDFTSSGLTHSSTNFSGEPNRKRVLNVIKSKSFGLVKFYFKSNSVALEMRGVNNLILQQYKQSYP